VLYLLVVMEIGTPRNGPSSNSVNSWRSITQAGDEGAFRKFLLALARYLSGVWMTSSWYNFLSMGLNACERKQRELDWS
jgi:hypothetical protein